MLQHGMELADMMVEPVPGGKGLATCLTVVLVLTGEMYVLHVLSEEKQQYFQLDSINSQKFLFVSIFMAIFNSANLILWITRN